MKLLVLLAVIVGAATAANCRAGYWGSDCNVACGACKDNAACDKNTGKCPKGCETGWNGANCDSAECFTNDGGCAEGGKCVAPNYCVCGEVGAQVVGITDPDGNVNCVSLRKDGIKGAFIAIAVMAGSISLCGLIAEKGKKRH
jgi:hypothetical protein